MLAPLPLRTAATALLAAWLLALPARAAIFDDDEARKRIDQTNQRLVQVQKQLEDRMSALEGQLKSQGLVELFGQVEQIRADIARLRGQIEVLTYEQEQAQKRSRDLYIDLDSRLRKLEGGPAAGVSGAPAAAVPGVAPSAGPATAPPASTAVVSSPPATGGAPAPVSGTLAGRPGAAVPDAANEQRSYDAAYDQFKAANYPAAIASFGAFVKANPKSPLAPSAQYWIGNAQFAQKDYRAAIASQRQLIVVYPDSQKVPDALLNIATSQFEMGDGAAARRTLEQLIAKYPQAEASAKARQRLAIR
ncbi:MAG: tol-pal system protein YbgF [Betaproteobacteria bacterium]